MLLIKLHIAGLPRLADCGLLHTGGVHLNMVKALPDKHAHGAISEFFLLPADVGIGAFSLVA